MALHAQRASKESERLIRQDGLTLEEIARHMDVSVALLERALPNLIAKGLIEEMTPDTA